jgi:hypothetical protein
LLIVSFSDNYILFIRLFVTSSPKGNIMHKWIMQCFLWTCICAGIAAVVHAQDLHPDSGISVTKGSDAEDEDSGQSLEELEGTQLRIINQIKQHEEDVDVNVEKNLKIPENYKDQTKNKKGVPDKKVPVWDSESPEPSALQPENKEKEENKVKEVKEPEQEVEGEEEGVDKEEDEEIKGEDVPEETSPEVSREVKPDEDPAAVNDVNQDEEPLKEPVKDNVISEPAEEDPSDKPWGKE